MKATAIIRLNFSSDKQLKVILEALRPETETSATPRSKVNIKAERHNLVLKLKATDTSALRAALNSYLRLIGVAINIQKLTEES
jgi:tRNA threonylcarbamoyladenosine modification (KEOPS) complex  Pcc1 subunit